MSISKLVAQADFEHAVQCRRHLHQYPEVGFELPNTAAFVRSELQKLGLEPTDRYGAHSMCVDLGPKDGKLLALRADMDALPVQEKTGLSYASKIDGCMHACGHDAHTAILLVVAKLLKEQEDQLPCGIRLIFQPNEEGAQSGAKMLVDAGIMDGVDAVIGTHCDNGLEVGTLGICPGDYQAACAPITLRFLGKTSHATVPEEGVDAIAMAHLAYTRFREAIARLANGRPYIWSVGTFQGGFAHNVICDECRMDISFRFYDNALCEAMHREVLQICDEVCAQFGGQYDLDWHISTGPVHNDRKLTAAFIEATEQQLQPMTIIPNRMSSEDFGWYLTKAPGLVFRFGTQNAAKGCLGAAHTNDFIIDEDGMRPAIAAFVNFARHADLYFCK